MACNKQERSEYEHGGRFSLIVDIFAKDGGNSHCEQGENREDGGCRLAFVAHEAICNQGDNGDCKGHVAHGLIFGEVTCKSCRSHNDHNYILDYGNGIRCPERAFERGIEGDVALQHIYGILLEREDGRVVEYAQQGDQPKTGA